MKNDILKLFRLCVLGFSLSFVFPGSCYSGETARLQTISFLTSDGMETRVVSNETEYIKTAKTNLISFEYVLPPTEQVKVYEYMLEGVDKEWTWTLESGNVIYSNIRKGDYVFRLREIARSGDSRPEHIHQQLRVVLPLWNSNIALFFYLLFFFGGLVFFIHYRTKSLILANQMLREKEQKSIEVAEQREELAIKNRNITDSIRYAQKIQESLLPENRYFKTLLPESFVLFRPKDIVSGDFYWISEAYDKIFVVSADCTGHGVPGALMSMIGFELLARVIQEKAKEHPSEILEIISNGIESTFSRNVQDPLLKDGIDIGLVMIDKNKREAEFSGGFNTMYLIRDDRLTEIKGDRLTVGTRESGPDTNFRNHFFKLEENDRIYLFSDGYPDQFGGPKGKKFMYRRFKHLLLTIHKKPMDEQLRLLDETLVSWMGGISQIDDIQVIGFQPLALLKKLKT